MKNQQQTTKFGLPNTMESSAAATAATAPASVSRNSPAKAAIKAVLPPVIPSIQRNVDAFYSYNSNSSETTNSSSLDSSSSSSNDLQFFYDGNNYYSTRAPPPLPSPALSSFLNRNSAGTSGQQRSNSIGSDRSLIVGGHNRYSSVSGFGENRPGNNNETMKIPFLSSRVSVQSYESIISSSSNKDSENSCISSSSVSTSSSFCSSASSSSSSCSFAANGGQSNHQQPAMLLSSPKANSSNNNKLASVKNASSSHKKKMATDNLIAKAGPLSIPEMLLHGIADSEMIHIWLQKIGMVKYEENFICAGYDMATISKMNPQDLSAIGITDPKARSLFTAEIQKLKIPDNIPNHKPDSLIEWLKLLNMECYHQSLCQQGYDTVDRVTQLTWEDLEDVGINKLGHQKKILLAIKKIKTAAKIGDISSTVVTDTSLMPPPDEVIYSPGKATTMMMEPITIECHNIQQQQQQQPYQDVLIKMYASNQADSPTASAVVDRPQFEPMMMICPASSRKNAGPLIDSKSRMLRTFQQQQNPAPVEHHHMYQGPVDKNPMVVQQQQQNSHYLRRRSLESLNKNEMIMMNGGSNSPNPYSGSHHYNHNNYLNNPYLNKPMPMPTPTFQYSNCDLQSSSSLNNCRQTVCLNGQQQHDYEDYYGNNHLEFAGGTATLNRPKILSMMNGNRQFPGSSPTPRTSSPEFFHLSPKQQNAGGYDSAKLNHSSSDLYAAFKKPKQPPPPPRRVHSMRETPSAPVSPVKSLPVTPTHHSSQGLSGSMLQNESFFASCVKSLTNNFSEMNRGGSGHHHENKPIGVARQQSFTFPSMNKTNIDGGTMAQEPSIVSNTSSSSGESMYFASDNVGTIRQRGSPASHHFSKIQSQFIEKPSAASAAAALQPNNNSGQNIVDSLEHIEMMLATLKTQLDSIE